MYTDESSVIQVKPFPPLGENSCLEFGLLTHPSVCTVDKSSFRQKGLQESSQIACQVSHLENLSYPSCHIYHSLMREAHVESLVAPLESARDRGDSLKMVEQAIILVLFTFTA